MIYLPDPYYNPDFVPDASLNTKTHLSKRSSIGKYFINTGKNYDYDNLQYSERLSIAKNLYLFAEFEKVINTSYGPYKDIRLVVSEGLYQPEANEVLSTGSINFLRNKGRAIVYEVMTTEGIVNEITFEVANYIKDNARFDRLILDYDLFEGTLHSGLIVTMPVINDGFEVKFRQEIQTQFNNVFQTNGEFVEIKG